MHVSDFHSGSGVFSILQVGQKQKALALKVILVIFK